MQNLEISIILGLNTCYTSRIYQIVFQTIDLCRKLAILSLFKKYLHHILKFTDGVNP